LPANERLDTLDAFGSRNMVIPAEVQGRFRTARNVVNWLLLIVFLALPWIHINGLQAVWINIPARRFELFGQLFLAHDTPLLFFLLMTAALSLALVTALWGRVWCGWACPQTVFIDGVYRKVEIWILGKYIARRKFLNEPTTLRKVFKLAALWGTYLLISSIIAHSFIAYFTGSRELIAMIQRPPGENWSYFLIVTLVTGLLVFNFGWFREQFCVIMCPYGRFQSVLQDSNSITVMYDVARGEPRKGSMSASPQGDCVSCNRCVQVCPTGIDIRNGTQMECIACTACVDACDEIMRKVHKPEGLIRHDSISQAPTRLMRPRILVYLALILFCVVGFSIGLVKRQDFDVTFLGAKDAPYQLLPEQKILNHFRLHWHNHSRREQLFTLQLTPEMTARGVELRQNQTRQSVPSGSSRESHFFVIYPRSRLDQNGVFEISVELNELNLHKVERYTVKGVGPFQMDGNDSSN